MSGRFKTKPGAVRAQPADGQESCAWGFHEPENARWRPEVRYQPITDGPRPVGNRFPFQPGLPLAIRAVCCVNATQWSPRRGHRDLGARRAGGCPNRRTQSENGAAPLFVDSREPG